MMMTTSMGSAAGGADAVKATAATKAASGKGASQHNELFAMLLQTLGSDIPSVQRPVRSPVQLPSVGHVDTAKVADKNGKGGPTGGTKKSQQATKTDKQQAPIDVISAGIQFAPLSMANFAPTPPQSNSPGRRTTAVLIKDPKNAVIKAAGISSALQSKTQTTLPQAPSVLFATAASGVPQAAGVKSFGPPQVADVKSSGPAMNLSTGMNSSPGMSSSSGMNSSPAIAPAITTTVVATAPAQFGRMLQASGVPMRDVGRISGTSSRASVQPPVQLPQHPLQMKPMADDAKAAAAIGRTIAKPTAPVPNTQLNEAMTVSVSGHHGVATSGVTHSEVQESTSPVNWSVLDSDANRQFAAMLAKHVATSSASQTLTVQVHPQGLGTLTVTVAQNSSGLNVQIQASNVQTAQWLQTETGRLTQAVQMTGLPVTAVQVGVSDMGADNRRGHGQGGDTRRAAAPTRNLGVVNDDAVLPSAYIQGLDATAQNISIRA